MLKRSTALSAVLFWTIAGLALPAGADVSPSSVPAAVQDAEPVDVVDAAPERVTAIEHIDLMVEGEQVSVRARHVGTPQLEIDAGPIFDALKSRFEARDSILGYWRFQDGAVMGLDFSDGKVRANGVVLGKLPDFPVRETADTWLGPNGISVLTGTQAVFDEATGWTFELDDRLKPQFDLDLWVNGAPAPVPAGLEPRTIGPVLLLPLPAVADALGHTLERDDAAGTVTITRIHDSAVISLEVATGLVTVNGVPSGVSPNMSYADPLTLVLPFSAVETLTGTNIELTPGTSRVDVTLDDRLSSLALPGDRVDDTAETTPFTPEKLDYQVSDRGPVKLDFYSRMKGFNTKTTYETVGGLAGDGGLGPRWMSVDIQALDGWRATVGDYSGGFRELNGTGTSRIRGVAFRRKQSSDTILAIAAGVPLTGATPVSERASKPEFGGFSAGARIIKADGTMEYGIAASVSEDGGSSRIVATGQKAIDVDTDGGPGLQSAYVAGDVGIFDDAAGSGIDVRGQAEARYRLSDTVGLQARATYDGARFQGGTGPAIGSGEVTTASRTVIGGAIDWHAKDNWGALQNVAGGVRTSVTHMGGTQSTTTVAGNAAINARIGDAGPNLALDAGLAQSSGAGETATSSNIGIRGFQSFDWGSVTAAYTRGNSDGVTNERFVATSTLPVFKRRFDKGAMVQVGPSASYVWSPEVNQARIGASVMGNSGQMLGERLNVRGQVAALTSVDPDKQSANLFGSLTADYRISDRVGLQAAYSDDFGGRRDLSIALRGSVLFNEPRKHSRPKDGTGVLKGRVFLDTNRDGIRQADEPGIPGVRMSVMNTRLALNVDNSGGYTIQNIKTGLYTLTIDRRSLPLGLLIAEGDNPRATIGDGRVTTLDIPVIASGQVRGAVFMDANENNVLDKGETRLEGQWIRLSNDTDEAPQSIQSASFGQYGFENLAPGTYQLRVNVAGRVVDVDFTLTEEDLFAVVQIPVPPDASRAQSLSSGGVLGTP